MGLLCADCRDTEMDGEEAKNSLPVETVEKIVAMMPFPSIFKSRSVSRSWLAKLSSIPIHYHEERKLRISSFQREVSKLSSNWPTFCPVFIGREHIIAYDQTSQNWRQFLLLSCLPDSMFLKSFSTRRWLPDTSYQIEGALLFAFSRTQVGFCQKEMYVANMLTQRWKQLPPRPREDSCLVHCSKLVCDVSSNSYKVILFCIQQGVNNFNSPLGDDCMVQTYDSKSNAWATQVFTHRTEFYSGPVPCAYLDGVLYVVTHRLNDSPNLLAFNLAEGSLEEVPLSFRANNRIRIRHVDLLVCNGNRLVMVTRGAHPEKMQVLKVDIGSEQLLQLSQGPPAPFRVRSISIDPVTYGHCIMFRVDGGTVDPSDKVLAYNVDEDKWSSFPIPIPSAALSPDCKRYKWIGSSCQPGLNPFVGV